MAMTGVSSKWSSGSLIFTPKKGFAQTSFQLGEFSSATQGSGWKISSTRSAAFRVYGDDGGSALTTGALRAGLSRMLIATAITSGDPSVYGFQGHLKVVANLASTAYCAGLWGYCEVAGASVTSVAGVEGMVDIPTGATIASGKIAAAFRAQSNDLSGTHTGKAAVLHVPGAGAGSWDFLIALASTAMTYDTTSITSDMTPTGYKGIPVLYDTTTYYIPMATAWA